MGRLLPIDLEKCAAGLSQQTAHYVSAPIAVHAPNPRWYCPRIRPKASSGIASFTLHPIQRCVCDVAVECPRHTGSHLLGIGVDAIAGHVCHGATVAIQRTMGGDRTNLCLLVVAQRSQMVPCAVGKWLVVLGRVDFGESNLQGVSRQVSSSVATSREGVAVADADDSAEEQR
jgi:hypothetical protein